MNITWNADFYKDSFRFVPSYGEAVTELLTAAPGSTVVDLGCGNGTLTKKLSEKGYHAVGVDASQEMLRKAEEDYPGIEFRSGNAETFRLDEPVDAIFSNAVFHWIDDSRQDRMIRNLADNLRPGGELVFEFGGKGCAEKIHSTLEQIFAERGLSYTRNFYFPTIGEYAPRLEKHGFLVTLAALFNRPTPQKGEHGLSDWIRMFDTKPFEGMSAEETGEILKEIEKRLRPVLFRDGTWYIDYVRIRMRAVRNG